MREGPRATLLRLAAAAGLAFAVAFHHSRAFALPGPQGWRGILDPPGAARIGAALLVGTVLYRATLRWPVRVVAPLAALLLGLLPALPLATGVALPLLAFQGPVLILAGAAALAVAVQRLAAWRGATPGLPHPGWLFAAAFAFYAALAARVPGPAGPQGDEPHYLAMAHSLVGDGDLDLADEFAAGEYHAFFPGALVPHASPNAPPGRLYSLHAPGLALLLAPGYALGGFRGAQLAVAAIVALAGVLVHRLVRDALGPAPAAAAWIAFAFGPPVAVFAVSLYPESVALLPTAGLLLAARARPGPGPALAGGLLAGALPWLHTKMMGPAVVGLLLVMIRPHRWRHRLAGLAGFGLLVGTLLLLFDRWYGRPSLDAAFGAPDLAVARVPSGLAGLFLDRQYGLWVFAPVWALALYGLAVRWSRRTGDLLRGLLVAAPTILVSAAFPVWWGGSSPPARFMVPTLAGMVVALGAAAVARPGLFAALAGWGIAMVGLAADAPRLLHNRPDGEGLLLRHLSRAADLNAVLPSFVAPRIVGGRPLVDPRVAALDVLEAYDERNAWSAAGALHPSRLLIPFDLPRRPWTVEEREIRHSRRLGLPPGRYRLRLLADLEAAGVVDVEAHSGEIVLGRARLEAASPVASIPLLLPVGARFLGVSAIGVAGRATLREAILVPEVVVPLSRRDGLRWPEMPLPDRYRVDQGLVRVTVLDRTETEAGAFVVRGTGAFVLDGPAGAPVRVTADRPLRVSAGASGGVEIAAGPAGHVVTLSGPDLLGLTAMPVRVFTNGTARVWFRPETP